MAAVHSLYLREGLHKKPCKRVFRDRNNPLEILTEGQIKQRYRFRPTAIFFIVDMVKNKINLPTKRSLAVPPLLQVLIALRVLATGSFYSVIADTEPRVGRATVCRVFWRVVRALLSHLKEYVRMPNGRQVDKVKEEFYAVAGFPNVIGCIDGTHIPIQAPSVDENDYVNRKGFHSINCQMVCDPWNRFTNVVAKWPGSAHDSWILRECGLGQQLVEGKHNGTLLGDSGYPCREYLLVPYPKPEGRAQEKFNRSFCMTRVKIEQSFGILKRKFACLKMLRVSPERACHIICATVILHNIAVDFCDTDDDGDLPLDLPDTVPTPIPPGDDRNRGKNFRNLICERYFNN